MDFTYLGRTGFRSPDLFGTMNVGRRPSEKTRTP